MPGTNPAELGESLQNAFTTSGQTPLEDRFWSPSPNNSNRNSQSRMAVIAKSLFPRTPRRPSGRHTT